MQKKHEFIVIIVGDILYWNIQYVDSEKIIMSRSLRYQKIKLEILIISIRLHEMGRKKTKNMS